jgi:CRISPR-associated protein Csy3
MAKTPATTIKTASVLSFNRHLDPSDGRMTAGAWNDQAQAKQWPQVVIQEKSVRGTISNRTKNSKDIDPAKIDASIQNANLQTVDVASLLQDADTLAVRFSLRVLGDVGHPSACNESQFRARLDAVISQYKTEHGFKPLATRYATSLASGRFLWRNRIGAEQVTVRIQHVVDGKPKAAFEFNALDYLLNQLSAPTDQKDTIEQLANLIAAGLAGEQHVLLDVIGFARLGQGQEVYPSQELILDKASTKSKTLYTLPDQAAGMHSQKIGNALRTIDTWYGETDDVSPIAIEPYGSVTSQGRAYRQPKDKKDFYNLFDDWVNAGKVPSVEQQHYVMAILIRGGVFGESDK